jgi:hypothetical protein
MIKEYDIVYAVRDISKDVLKDCKGTVLIVHQRSPSAYEVEFVNENLQTIDVLTVNDEDITLLTSTP